MRMLSWGGRIVAIMAVLAAFILGPITPANAALPSLRSCPTMAVGSQGECVESLQYNLSVLGIGLSIDGIFGEQTRKAVVGFQQSQGLDADGIVGPLTRDRLDKVANSPEALGQQGPVAAGPPPTDEGAVDGGELDCGNLFGTCSFYFDRPTTKRLHEAVEDYKLASGAAEITTCASLSIRTKSATAGLACEFALLVGGEEFENKLEDAAEGNGCLRVRWLQDPMIPLSVHNDGGRHCTG